MGKLRCASTAVCSVLSEHTAISDYPLYQRLLMSSRRLLLILSLLCCFANQSAAGITAEQVLGEYWKDPLFGEAAAELSISIEILSHRLWPELIKVSAGKNIRFVFLNKSDEPHLIAFSADMNSLLGDQKFQRFVKDELSHAEKKVITGENHSHADSSANDAATIVKTLIQRPTVFVLPQDKKEILIHFDEAGSIAVFCVLDGHYEQGFVINIDVIR